MSTCVICCEPADRRRCSEFTGCACVECVFHDPCWDRYLAQGFHTCPICSTEMIGRNAEDEPAFSILVAVEREREEAERRERQKPGLVEIENVFRILAVERPAPGLVRFVSAWSLALSMVPLVLLTYSLTREDLSGSVQIAGVPGAMFATHDAFYALVNLINGLPVLATPRDWLKNGAFQVAIIARAAWYVFVVVLFIQHNLGGYAAIGFAMMLLRTWFGTLFLAALGRIYMCCANN